MTEDGQLLRQYTRQGSQAAFSRLVSRYLNLVYSVCLREVQDAALAEDVTQVVFLLLAKKAPSLGPDTRLAGWLFQTARFAAKNALRREAHRRLREQRVGEQMLSEGREEDLLWDRIEPGLNDALAALGAKDREAVLLRFAEGLSFPELGAALGTSEDAARMRLNRALDRLRQFFAKQGVTLSAAVLAGLLTDRTAEAAPAACAAAVTKIAGGVGNGNAAFLSPNVHSQLQGALKAMTTMKRSATLAAVLMIGSAGVLFNVFRHASAQVLETNQESQDVKSISDPLSSNPAVRAVAQQRHIEQAKLLRDRWQPWAKSHRDLLSQMLHAQPSNTEVLARVYETIPAAPGRGSRPGAAGISHDDLHTAGALFTWNAFGKDPIQGPADPALLEQLTKSNIWFIERMRGDFSKYRDFRLTESASTGRYHTVLWVSGRITVMVDRDRFVGHGKPFEDYQEVQAEVSPEYDFLR